MKRCKQCGMEITEEGQPEGFCSEGCKWVYAQIERWDNTRIAR